MTSKPIYTPRVRRSIERRLGQNCAACSHFRRDTAIAELGTCLVDWFNGDGRKKDVSAVDYCPRFTTKPRWP